MKNGQMEFNGGDIAFPYTGEEVGRWYNRLSGYSAQNEKSSTLNNAIKGISVFFEKIELEQNIVESKVPGIINNPDEPTKNW